MKKMKRNIVLIDPELRIYKSISKSKKVNIELLIADFDEIQLEEARNFFGIKNIISREKFHEFTDQKTIIDYETIEKFTKSQLDSEHFQDRYSDDVNHKQYLYFNALSFWINFFNDNNIYAVILDGLAHGANYDSLALDVAIAHGIPGYILEGLRTKHSNGVSVIQKAVLNYKLREWVPLDHGKLSLKNTDIESFTFYLQENRKKINKIRSFKGLIKLFLPTDLITAIFSLRKILLKEQIVGHGLLSQPSNILRNLIYIRSLRRFYKSITVKFDPSKKYLLYALHVDPEATTMDRALLNNQLTIIKQISQAMPRGWNLYVKEHPGQFMNHSSQGGWYFLCSIHKYRTKNFYKELLKMENVHLLDVSVNSKDIITSAKAIATINGSISIEALHLKKPLLMFGHKSSPFGLVKDVFRITSTDHCQAALNSLESGFTPDYSDVSKITNNFLYEVEPNHDDSQLLVDYLVCEYSL